MGAVFRVSQLAFVAFPATICLGRNQTGRELYENEFSCAPQEHDLFVKSVKMCILVLLCYGY